jgi:cobalt-zinc-cadmium efflux system outer membrane protein
MPNTPSLLKVLISCLIALQPADISVADSKKEMQQAVSDNSCLRQVTLEEFRAIALEKSPLVAEIDSQYAREVAKAYDTEVFRNPEVQFEQVYTNMQLGGDNDPQTNASLALPLRLSNFGAKSRVAALIKSAGDKQRKAKLLELAQRLVSQYANLYALQKTDELLAEAEKRASKKVELIHEGVNKGLLSEGDHQLFEGEKYRLQSQRAGLRSALAVLRYEQSLLLGTPCSISALTPPNLGDLPDSTQLIKKAHSSEISELARVDLLASLNVEQRRLAELDAVPEFAPRIVYQHTNDGGDFLGAGISIPLPVFNRNRGNIESATAEQESARRKRELLSDGGFDAQVVALREAAASAAQQSRIFQSKVVPAFAGALQSQERLYSQGKGNVLQVWQTLRTYNDAQREALTVWLEAVSARSQLAILIGEEI